MFDLQTVNEFVDANYSLFFLSEEKQQTISDEHKDQIQILTKEASEWLINFVDVAGLVDGAYTREPLTSGTYQQVENFRFYGDESEKRLKKWLYNRGLPFQKQVFLVDYYEKRAVALSWKMVIKFNGDIFYGSDKVIFDQSLNWCLAQFVNDTLYFGKKASF